MIAWSLAAILFPTTPSHLCATNLNPTSNNSRLDLPMVLKLSVAPRHYTKNHQKANRNARRQLPLLELTISFLHAKALPGTDGIDQLRCEILLHRLKQPSPSPAYAP